jgi:hypothetical protein
MELVVKPTWRTWKLKEERVSNALGASAYSA